MMIGQISIEWQRRSALVNMNEARARYNKTEVGDIPCYVLGLFQYNNGEDEVCPYFICELYNGRNIYADPTDVRFTDTDENGVIQC